MMAGKLFQDISGRSCFYVTASNEIVIPDQRWLDSWPAAERETAVLREAGGEDIPGPPFRWPMSREEYHAYLTAKIPRLTLEVTRRCTLRCDYCIYSGNYRYVRTHEALDMPLETAQQSIRVYASRSTGSASRLIRFYGGETFMNFPMIRDSVAYANRLCADKPLHYSISTNGTTLTDKVIEWLAQNRNVTVSITLNGPEHDQYRRFPSGEGSLTTIMNTIKHLWSRHPEVWEKQIHFIANITSDEVLPELRSFYLDKVGKMPSVITRIFPYGGNEIIQNMIDRRNVHKPSALAYSQTGDAFLAARYRYGIEQIALRPIIKEGSFNIPVGCCMPFQGGIFVAANGTFGMCERTSPAVPFGDLDHGFCEDVLDAFLVDAISLFDQKCRFCWGRRLCDLCFSSFMDDRGLPDKIPEEVCLNKLEQICQDLGSYSSIASNNRYLLHKLKHHC